MVSSKTHTGSLPETHGTGRTNPLMLQVKEDTFALQAKEMDFTMASMFSTELQPPNGIHGTHG